MIPWLIILWGLPAEKRAAARKMLARKPKPTPNSFRRQPWDEGAD